MKLTVEVDKSNLPYPTFYIDEKSQDIEKMLRETSEEYSDCIVRRCHQSGEFEEYGDPLAIQSSEEKVLAWIYEWEIDALNSPEIVAIISTRRKRGEISDSAIPLFFGGGFAAFFGGIMVGLHLLLPIVAITPTLETFFVPGLLLIFMGLVVFVIGSRRDRSRKKKLDIETARADRSFLDALRKLASISDTENKYVAEFRERLREVEKEIL